MISHESHDGMADRQEQKDSSPHEALCRLSISAARQIASDCSGTGEGDARLRECGAPLVQLLGRQAQQVLRFAEGRTEEDDVKAMGLVSRRLADLVAVAHGRFYAFVPSDVPACWRQLYTDASILQFAQRWSQLARDADADADATIGSSLDRLVRPLDMALILAGGAGPRGRGRGWIHAALDALQGVWEAGEGRSQTRDWTACPTFAGPAVSVPPVSRPVERRGRLGLAGFQAYVDGSRRRSEGPQPLVMTGLTDHWPARRPVDGRPWTVPAYLRWRTLNGRRLVPVEIGRSYVDAGWRQAVVPLADVLTGLCSPERDADDAGPVYLAQHALFTQMPRLRDDICVVGRKYVRLYGPAQTAALRPRGCEGGVDMGNTSSLDIPYVDCILEPGDTLYIPRGWWHYVRGLTVSFSVSFWWD
ncbi:lysine-specific demethylase 8 [Grosmannia clavigera kw1407]|uniref:Lysine-specific demethylase 8 n=1 Tax=Grosmannia clavigera (strain kw1407 / UAMH 11150) TaxID=655863 RepID=F0XFI8_GROCL|nr:lysine-specific demethylase 8 [Grosmannia clavigera kw1407]EFX03648.1 lysine-specific demethylase 8 [Grosmannia clavigera kw1407]